MNEVIMTILERRSIRKYQEKQITREELDLILETGLYAPTSGGMQRVEMFVCQDKEICFGSSLSRLSHNISKRCEKAQGRKN